MPTLPTTTKNPEIVAMLRRFLNCYWLRPENAFWMVLRSQVLREVELTEPCVDISCGDGIFSFLHAGGDFDLDFDVFTSVGRLDKVRDEHADMFDHIDQRYRPRITRQPDRTLAVGTDWKQTLLDKAALLNLYDRLVLHDSNLPLPFEDASFATVYCNAIYWVKNIDAFLAETRRILQPGGKAVFEVKLDAVKEYTLEPFRNQLGDRWLELIGRGRFETWPSMGDQPVWEKRFESAGFAVASATPFITRTHAHIWDIGLRPIAPLLIRMAGAVTPETRRAIKADWIDLMTELLLPITQPDFDPIGGNSGPVEVLFVLTPR